MKKIFTAIHKAAQLIKNMFFLKEPAVHRTAFQLMGCKRFFQFLLNLTLPYGVVCRHLLLKNSSEEKGKVLVGMIESGYFHAAVRVITPEERLLINRAYLSQKRKDGYGVPDREFVLPQGYKNAGSIIPPESCSSVVSYLKNENGYLGHAPLHSNGILYGYEEAKELTSTYGRYFSYPPSTSLRNPAIAGVMDSPLVKDMVHKHLGDDPSLYALVQLNTFVVFPGEIDNHYVMKLHRDCDDFNFLVFFVYWSHVAADNGATLYIPGTHISSDSALNAHKVFFEGAPGEIFAMDGFGLHAGNNAVKTPRFVSWYRYGLKNNIAEAQGSWPLYKVGKLLTE